MKLWLTIFVPPIFYAMFFMWLLSFIPADPSAPPKWLGFIMLYCVGVLLHFVNLEGWALWRSNRDRDV